MDVTLMLPAILLAAVLLWWLASSRTTTRELLTPVVSSDISIAPVPFLTETQASLYNLLRLAVHDRYLVFAQVPLWAFVDVAAAAKLRSLVFGQIALKRVDFVLVHPGSRHVEQAILIDEASSNPREAERRAIIKSVLDAVGVPLRRMSARKSYAVADLSLLLGLDPEES
jgi:hypothetical protein